MKELYIWLVRLVSRFSKSENKFKLGYFMSFAGNQEFILKLAQSVGTDNFILFFEPQFANQVHKLVQQKRIKHIQVFNSRNLFQVVKLVNQTKTIFFDNYFAFLAGIKKGTDQKFVQIWHANGAIKSFGWEDPNTYQRTSADQKRFQKVYDSFDQFIVGSDAMAKVFEHSWHIPSNRIAEIGYPRSDKFLNSNWIQSTLTQIEHKVPGLLNKRVILYAPTYRKDVSFKLPKDWDKLQIPDETVLVLRLHPHLKALEQKIINDSQGKVIGIPQSISTEALLVVADTLITDYSSIAFDYSLLESAQSVIFFTYDLNEFEQQVGLQADFLEDFHTDLVFNIEKLNDELVNLKQSKKTLQKLNQRWNTKNDGKATNRAIKIIDGE